VTPTKSLMATRLRTYDMLACAAPLARRLRRAGRRLVLPGMWGGATFDTAMRFLSEDPLGTAAPASRGLSEYLLPDAFSAGRNAVGYSKLPPNVVAGFRPALPPAAGMDIFRIFRLRSTTCRTFGLAMEAVQNTHAICEAAICY